MIVPIIVIIIACSVIAVLSVLAYGTIRHNNHLEREKNMALMGKEARYTEFQRLREENVKLQAEKDTLKDENADLSEALETTKALYNKVLRERNELVARATALQEAIEARPTQPKRAVRKNSTAGEQQ